MRAATSTAYWPSALPGPPIVNVVDLPFPVSVNRLWRKGHRRIHLSPEYHNWRIQADLTAMLQRGAAQAHSRAVHRRSRARPRQAQARAMDLDNYGGKAILDWAQSRELILNDKFLEKLTIEWADHADAPEGCRLTLRELG